MKQLLLLVALLMGAPCASAAGRASEIVTALSAGFRSMASYGVSFEVRADEHVTAGRYDVRSENYYMVLGDAEVYCDGKVRYEIDNRRREVTITEVDPASRNILNNPVHAFDFLGSQYVPSLVSESGGRAVVLLTPAAGNASPSGTVTVVVDTASMRPQSLAYDLDGQRVEVEVRRVAPLAAPLKTFAKDRYSDYEFIDFR